MNLFYCTEHVFLSAVQLTSYLVPPAGGDSTLHFPVWAGHHLRPGATCLRRAQGGLPLRRRLLHLRFLQPPAPLRGREGGEASPGHKTVTPTVWRLILFSLFSLFFTVTSSPFRVVISLLDQAFDYLLAICCATPVSV